GARLARHNTGALLCACSVASFAVLLPWQLHLRCHSRGSFLERQRHVVPQVRSALRAASATSPTAGEHVLESEKIAKNIVEVLEDRPVEIDACATGSAQPRMSVGVIHLPLLLIAQNAVGLGALAKLHLSFRFVLWITVWVIFQRALTVGRLDFFDRSR